MNKKHTQRRSSEEWGRIVKLQETCGQSVADYCREHNVSEKTFYVWQRKLEKKASLGLKGFIKISPAVENHPTTLRITTPGGWQLEVPEGTDEKYVKTIMASVVSL